MEVLLMDFSCLQRCNWKGLLRLEEHQNKAIETALQLAAESGDIAALIEQDLKNLINGVGKLESAEELRIHLYGHALYRIHPVLVLLMRLPWLIDQYSAHQIPDNILIDTLSDVKIWMKVCEKKTGVPGLLEYGWLNNHFSFRLFRLGRLQFINQPGGIPAFVYRHRTSGLITALCPDGASYHPNGDGAGVNSRPLDDVWQATLRVENGTVTGFPIHRSGYALRSQVSLSLDDWELVYQPSDPVLDMHIAEGQPLSPEAVRESLDMAPEFFKQYLGVSKIHALTCSSWLLDDNIAQIQPNGNIAAFQRFFQLIPHADSSDWQTRQRAFGDPDTDILKAECRTSLQKGIAAWYASGRACRHAAGIIIL